MLTGKQIDALTIFNYPDPVLRAVCTPIESYGDWLEALGRRMIELMQAVKGVGLAAPQVGVPWRVFVIAAMEEQGQTRIFVNPELSDLSGRARADEGCLSLPDVTVPIDRAIRATVTACDPTGQRFQMTTEGLLARIWQHENDHLDGRLIVDYMDTQAELVNRKALKALKATYEAGRHDKR